ncbi:DUF5326 family protein [Streptomyces sp. MUM 203J]|uniref:DUF5326 family protein n=1 Tax=Streptomyces sp. MUM 203J TaxID=2791990 RepID=UPI0023D90618
MTAIKDMLAGLPWWVKWVAIPVIAVAVFGGMIASAVFFLVNVLFKVLLFVALVGGLVYVVRKVTGKSSSSSSSGW